MDTLPLIFDAPPVPPRARPPPSPAFSEESGGMRAPAWKDSTLQEVEIGSQQHSCTRLAPLALGLLLIVASALVLRWQLFPTDPPDGDGVVYLHGASFPALFVMADSPLWYCGGGDRTFLFVRLYTLAAYLSEEAFGACQLSDTIATVGLRGTISTPAAKALVIHMQHSASLQQMIDSLVESVQPRLPAATAAATISHLHDAIMLFGQPLEPGNRIFMACHAGVLSIALDEPAVPPEAEQRVDPLVEPGLCMAMWDMYLGQEAISADIKRGFVAGERRREAALCGREVEEEEEEGGGLDVGGVASAAAGATQQAFGALSSGAGALAGSIHWPRRRGQG